MSGFSLLSGSGENVGLAFAILHPWDERKTPDLKLNGILARVRPQLAAIPSANIFAFGRPAIQGLGNTSGFNFQLQAMGDQSPQELSAATRALVGIFLIPALYTTFQTDREKLKAWRKGPQEAKK